MHQPRPTGPLPGPPADPLGRLDTPANGHLARHREARQARRRALRNGTWLQRVGITLAVLVAVWVTLGDDVVSRWQQYELRQQMAQQLDGPALPTPEPAPAAPPLVFGLGAPTPEAQQVQLVALPGEEVTTEATNAAPEQAPPPAAEDVSFRIRAPKIGMDWVVGSGVGVPDLKRGPGWMPGTAVPGHGGNTVVSGHRTTYGAPFNRIDELAVGDQVVLDLPGGQQAVYEVADRFVVRPDEVGVVRQVPGSRLTLTTCTPTGTAQYRLIVQAVQVSGPGAQANDGLEFTPYQGARIDDPALRD